jgi:hypothetical protein
MPGEMPTGHSETPDKTAVDAVQLEVFCGVWRYVALRMRLRLGMHANGPERHIIPIRGFVPVANVRWMRFSIDSAIRRQRIERTSLKLRGCTPENLDTWAGVLSGSFLHDGPK